VVISGGGASYSLNIAGTTQGETDFQVASGPGGAGILLTKTAQAQPASHTAMIFLGQPTAASPATNDFSPIPPSASIAAASTPQTDIMHAETLIGTWSGRLLPAAPPPALLVDTHRPLAW
jgi:hypothetical protein